MKWIDRVLTGACGAGLVALLSGWSAPRPAVVPAVVPAPTEHRLELRAGEHRALALPPGARVRAHPATALNLVAITDGVVVLEPLTPGEVDVDVDAGPDRTHLALTVLPAPSAPPPVVPPPVSVAASVPSTPASTEHSRPTSVAATAPSTPPAPPMPLAEPPPPASPYARIALPLTESALPPAPFPRLLGTLALPRGGVAFFVGKEARRGDRIGPWEVLQVFEDAVRVKWRDRVYRIPVSGKPQPEPSSR